ncbi:hypothetical protein BJ166DRAFT_586987 [Pestalotiopsis sp. NC0098]|nr:hypothetical protein BJ166DRAFT_586987 [Pestalotiopsis sp. NC0098]
MRYSLSTVLLACGLQLAAGAAVEARQNGPECSSGPQVIGFDNLPALPADTINEGVVSGFNPYHELNYTHFAVGNIGANDNAILYKVHQIQPGPWNWMRKKLYGAVGVHGQLPPKYYPPSIVGSTPDISIRLTSLKFGCGVRSGNGPPTHFPCYLIIRPIEATNPTGDYHICRYQAAAPGAAVQLPGLQECDLPNEQWTLGRGFTFQTVGRVPRAGWFDPQSFNTTLASTLLTAIDDVSYTQYCKA